MKTVWIVVGMALVLAACGVEESTTTISAATTTAATSPNPPDGEEIFSRTLLDGRPGCITCHSLEPDVVLVGESMVGLVGRAEAASPGNPRAYIRTSIEVPDAAVLDGYSAGSMPQADLSDAELDALVDYLMSVGS